MQNRISLSRRLLLAIMLMTSVFGFAGAEESAQQLTNRVSQAFLKASSVTADFKISGAMGNLSGKYTASGKKFALVTGGLSTWYNGKTLWSYNPRTQETTIVNPSSSEAAENNPFSVIYEMSGQFNASYAKSQPAGSVVLVLIAKQAKSDIKKAVVTLDKKRLVPTKIVITSSAGTTTVIVSNLAANKKVAASAFDYPKSKYPKAKIVDLR